MKAPAKSSASSSRAASTAEPSGAATNGLFAQIAAREHEQVSFASDPRSGYRGIIAIHNTILGPSLGGTRLWAYRSEAEALTDALRLSRAMTYKAAVAGLRLGGGKSVIIAGESIDDRQALFRAHGRHVHWLGGRYITACDVGTGPADMEIMHQETPHVTGLASGSGDPAPVTAFGVYRGIKACAHHRSGDDSLRGRTVAVQGLGHVGYNLCRYLHEEGARLVVTDVRPEKVQRAVTDFGARGVALDDIYDVEAEIFAPCALGAVINDHTVPRLRVSIVAGAANNQLALERHGDALEQRGITYAPDYVINGGGLINVSAELEGWTREQAHEKAGEIYHTVLRVLTIAKEERIAAYRAADRLARQRLEEAATVAGEASRKRGGAR